MPRGKTGTKLCCLCSKAVSLFAYNRHIKAHENGNLVNSKPFIGDNCKYCEKFYDSKLALSNHETRCKLNPNRKIQRKSQESIEKLRNSNLGKPWSEERRTKHSEAMKLAVEKFPESYTSSNRGRTKQIIVDGIKFQGKWELEFYNYCKNNNILIERVSEWFEYEWNGIRKYFPDFYLPELDLYVEVKGYETERDIAKWKAFPKKLKVVKKREIERIRKGCFVDL